MTHTDDGQPASPGHQPDFAEKLITLRLTVFGATGGTGSHLVRQAVAAGHEVTAVVRDPARLPAAGPRLRVVTADVFDPDDIRPAVTGADAVLTALGPHGTGPTSIARDSLLAIIEAMRKADAHRLISVSGTIVTDEGEGPVMRHLVKPVVRATLLRHVCADMRRGEEEIRRSELDWTIVRPPGLTSKPPTGAYRTAIDRNLPRGFRLSRADLAACMLALTTDPASIRHHVCAAN
jgi:putative NADH-flavin reductase